MVNVFDVEPNALIEEVKEELKKYIKQPEWAKFVKTGVFKERPPMQEDWWYYRAAAIMRYMYVYGKPIGVERLRRKYGGAKRHMHRPGKKAKASGKIIRTILQQLEEIGFVKKVNEPKKGRILTNEGKSFLDKIAKRVYEKIKGKEIYTEIGKPVEIKDKKFHEILKNERKEES